MEMEMEMEMDGEHTSMAVHIQRMLGNPTFIDMAFVCGKEEEEIGACRMLVAARSPVLESMLLTSGMAESKLTRVHLPEIEPATMRTCLEFFYTDSVQESSWPTMLSAMKVAKAALFFLAKRLESLALVYMRRTNFKSKFDDDEEWIADVIASYNLSAELYPASDFRNTDSEKFSPHIEKLVGINKWYFLSRSNLERLIYKNLSELALVHFIWVLHYQRYYHPTFECYNLFLHLVRWCAYRIILADSSIREEEVEEELNRCIVVSLDFYSSLDPINARDDAKTSRFLKLLADPVVKCLQAVPFVIEDMPADILCVLIEPLDVIPSSILLKRYRDEALNGPHLTWDVFGHGSNYVLGQNDLTKISCVQAKKFEGIARCGTCLHSLNDAFCEWEIAILRPCENLRIGFLICDISGPHIDLDTDVLGDMEKTWALGGDGVLYERYENFGYSIPYANAFHDKEGVIVQLHIDLKLCTCSFSINGEYSGVAWDDLPLIPDEEISEAPYVMFPAISLQHPGEAQVRNVSYSHLSRKMLYRRLQSMSQ